MQVRQFADPEAFQKHVTPFLLEREAENNLIFGILGDIIQGRYSDITPYLACVEDKGEIVLVALRTPPHNLLLSTTTDMNSLPALVKHVHQVYEALPGLSAIDDLADRFVQQWKTTTAQTPHLKMHQGIYQIKNVQPVPKPQGALHAADEMDRDLLIDWIQTFMSGISGDVSKAQAKSVLQKLTQQQDRARLFLWVVDKIPVTMAAYLGGTPNGFRVSYVYTPPEYRRQGYATACTAEVTQRALDRGATYCFLYTDLSNPISNHIYQTIGYEFVCSVKQYLFE